MKSSVRILYFTVKVFRYHNTKNKEDDMQWKCFPYILIFISSFFIIVSCAPQKPIVREEKPRVLPAETVEEETAYEEPVEEVGVIEEEEIKAIRSLEKEALKAGALEDVYFDFNRYNLKPEAQKKLQKTYEWLNKYPNVKILIEGHCDERGTQEYNLALGERRAASVKKYLQSLGMDSRRMETISYGEERPVDPRHNEEAWAKNRRAHITITSK
jgi:peptidoglycan-associated lipoprotein